MIQPKMLKIQDVIGVKQCGLNDVKITSLWHI